MNTLFHSTGIIARVPVTGPIAQLRGAACHSTDASSLEVANLSKSYGATKALVDVSFSVRPGTAHALLGENGAGKSTTIKLLSGLIRPDSGTISVKGRPVVFNGPLDSQRAGLQTAFQELALAPDLNILQNMVLGHEPRGAFGLIDWRTARHSVLDHFDRLGLNDMNLRAEARSLSLSQRQKVEIARALFRQPEVLFLDEATSALTSRDVDWLEGLVHDLKSAGMTVVMITHKMQEIRKFCEHVTVLRNGRDVGSFAAGDVCDEEIVEMIIGRSLDATFPRKTAVAMDKQPTLRVEGLSARTRLAGCSFDLRPGEILGVAALQGMGQKELFDLLFGVEPPSAGTVSLNGVPVRLGSPRQAINSGIALVPEERKTEGLFLQLSGLENMVAPILGRISRFGLLSRRRKTMAVAKMMKQVQLADRAVHTRAGAFSGGNQQKIVIGKWLLTDPNLLLLFDPCRGVDVGTKHEIYRMVNEFAAAGGSVLLYSSETPEVCQMCHRVLVLYGGRVAEVLSAQGPQDEISEKEIMRFMLGDKTPCCGVAQSGAIQ